MFSSHSVYPAYYSFVKKTFFNTEYFVPSWIDNMMIDKLAEDFLKVDDASFRRLSYSMIENVRNIQGITGMKTVSSDGSKVPSGKSLWYALMMMTSIAMTNVADKSGTAKEVGVLEMIKHFSDVYEDHMQALAWLLFGSLSSKVFVNVFCFCVICVHVTNPDFPICF